MGSPRRANRSSAGPNGTRRRRRRRGMKPASCWEEEAITESFLSEATIRRQQNTKTQQEGIHAPLKWRFYYLDIKRKKTKKWRNIQKSPKITLLHITSGAFHQLRVSHLHQLVFYTVGKNKEQNNGETQNNRYLFDREFLWKFWYLLFSVFLHSNCCCRIKNYSHSKRCFERQSHLRICTNNRRNPWNHPNQMKTYGADSQNFKSKWFARNSREQHTKYFKYEETNMFHT